MKNFCHKKMVSAERGITLFIAVIASSLLLLVSLAVVNITYKDILFSSSARDSQFAFYAADSGVECAMYWDFKNPSDISAFSITTEGTPRTINCNNQAMSTGDSLPGGVTGLIGGGGNSNPTSIFSFDYSPQAYCAIVTVNKYEAPGSPIIQTTIESRGYNTCDTSNPKRLERAIRIEY